MKPRRRGPCIIHSIQSQLDLSEQQYVVKLAILLSIELNNGRSSQDWPARSREGTPMFGKSSWKKSSLKCEALYLCSIFTWCSLSSILLMSLDVDLHRDTLPATYSSRLSSYFLWLLSQRMVFVASLASILIAIEPLLLPIMSCFSARDQAQCYGYHFARHVPPGKS